MRYQVRKVTHYEVVDTESDDAVHYNGKDEGTADQIASDMNENAQRLIDAKNDITRAAMQVSDNGEGADQPA